MPRKKEREKIKSPRMSPCPPRRHAEQTAVPQPRPTPPGRHPDPDEVRLPLWLQYPPAHLPSTDPNAQATSSFICRSLWVAGCPHCTQVEHRGARRAVGSPADRPLGIGTAGEFYKTRVKPLACARAVSRGPGCHQERGCVSLPGPVPPRAHSPAGAADRPAGGQPALRTSAEVATGPAHRNGAGRRPQRSQKPSLISPPLSCDLKEGVGE